MIDKLLSTLINGLSSKLTGLLSKLKGLINKPLPWVKAKLKEIMDLLFKKPSERKDYLAIGKRLVSKRFVVFFVVGVIAAAYLFFKFALPWMEGKLWTVDLNIGSEKYSTFSGKVRVHDISGTVIYEGDMSSGKMSGYGVQYNSSGLLIYKGNFENNAYSGEGEKYENDVMVYSGQFAANAYEGTGQLFNSEGVLTYAGSFSKGEKSGSGVEYSVDTGNQIYVGNYDMGQKSGAGTAYLEDGETLLYKGNYESDVYSGEGNLYENGNLLYFGGFADGKYSGEGTQYDPETQQVVYQGAFDSGLYNGEGTLYNTEYNVKSYEGSFENGKKNGEGTSYDILGSVNFSGQFKNDNIDFVNYLGKGEEDIITDFKKPSYSEVKKDIKYLTYSSLDLCLIFDPSGEEAEEGEEGEEGEEAFSLSRVIMGIKKAPYGLTESSQAEDMEEKLGVKAFSASDFTFNDMYKTAFLKLSLSLSGESKAFSRKYLPGDSGNYFIRVYYSQDKKKILGIEVSST